MPLSPRFLETLEDGDLFFPLSKWPPIARDYMLKTHKSNNERYYLMRFLCYNGLKPEIASNWILREGQYDDNALKDQQVMIKKARDQEFYAKGRIFNMRYGRTDSLYDKPPVESEWETQPPPPPNTPTRRIERELIEPPKTVSWTDILERFPRPKRHPLDTEEDFQFNLAVWRAETRKELDSLKARGYVLAE